MKNHKQFKKELFRRRDEKLRVTASRKRVLTACVSLALVTGVIFGFFYSPWTSPIPERNPVTVHAADLMENLQIPESGVEGKPADQKFIRSQMDFSLKLFQQCAEKDNTLISPLSVSLALAMTANGADGDTLEDMEKALGGLSIDDLNRYLSYYVNQLPGSENTQLSIANSIWFKNNAEQFTPKQTFLETAYRYYGADAYAAPFDRTTLEDINNWVSQRTDGMIDRLLDQIDPFSVMYLINTVLFDGQWATPYEDYQVREETFTSAAGKKQTISMMHSTECWYLEDDNAVGFMKDYENCDYRFVALLPSEDMTVEEYIDTLTADSLLELLRSAEEHTVFAGLPKFEYEASYDLNKALSKLGMGSAFKRNADFSQMGTTDTGDLFIGNVIHKSKITVNQKSTKAAAATAVVVYGTGAVAPPEDPITVTLDRPFVYLIIDTQTNLPLFMGTVTDLG